MWVFRQLKLIQKCKPLSFFHTNTMVLHQATLARSDGARFQHFLQVIPNLLNHWQWNSFKPFFKKGIVSYFYYMLCRMSTTQLCQIQGEHVHGIWPGAGELSASSRVHKSRPFKSNSSNNLPCLCLTLSPGVWGSWELPAFSCNFSPLGGPGTGNAATALATGVFFLKGLQVGGIVSVPPQELSYCLSLTWCMCSVQSGLGAGQPS